MIAIDTMSDTLATIVARLTPACPGAPRSCASASACRDRARRGHAVEERHAAMRGSRSSVPISSSAIAA